MTHHDQEHHPGSRARLHRFSRTCGLRGRERGRHRYQRIEHPGRRRKDPSTVKIADSPLGKILVDGKGRTLYLFTADGKNMNSMKCDAQCLKLWPPMEGKPKAGAGADAKLINTTDLAGRPRRLTPVTRSTTTRPTRRPVM